VYRAVRGTAPSGVAWEAWFAFFTAGFPAQKLLVAPRETADEIVAAYAEAVQRMKTDPEYLAKKHAELGDYEQLTGAEAERQYALATHVPAEQRAWIRGWLTDRFHLNLEG
jgi:hypothetical protein